MPFLMGAKAVTVIAINEKARRASSDQLVGHLARRGIAAGSNGWPRNAAMFKQPFCRSRPKQYGLLVMGGYGHSRFAGTNLGGVTGACSTR
jgi:hypothetical protein